MFLIPFTITNILEIDSILFYFNISWMLKPTRNKRIYVKNHNHNPCTSNQKSTQISFNLYSFDFICRGVFDKMVTSNFVSQEITAWNWHVLVVNLIKKNGIKYIQR